MNTNITSKKNVSYQVWSILTTRYLVLFTFWLIPGLKPPGTRTILHCGYVYGVSFLTGIYRYKKLNVDYLYFLIILPPWKWNVESNDKISKNNEKWQCDDWMWLTCFVRFTFFVMSSQLYVFTSTQWFLISEPTWKYMKTDIEREYLQNVLIRIIFFIGKNVTWIYLVQFVIHPGLRFRLSLRGQWANFSLISKHLSEWFWKASFGLQ